MAPLKHERLVGRRARAASAARVRENNRAENSHLAIRKHERQQQGFKSKASAQRFLTTQASIYSTFYTARHLISRRTLKSFRAEAHDVWLRETCA